MNDSMASRTGGRHETHQQKYEHQADGDVENLRAKHEISLFTVDCFEHLVGAEFLLSLARP